MSQVIDVALPVFAIILAGVVAGRAGLLGPAAPETLNRFVYWIALPPLLFIGTARRPVDEIFNGPFLGAFLGGLLAVFVAGAVLGRLIRREGPAVPCLQGLTASFANTGYMGIPLFLTAFGQERLAPAILATVAMTATMIALAVVWLELVRSHGKAPAHVAGVIVLALLRNPLVSAPALGVAWSALLHGVAVPRPVAAFCELTGAAAGPSALFAIGLSLAGMRLAAARSPEVGVIVALKLIVQPAVTALLIATLFPLDPFRANAAIILAALPTGALTFVMAQRYEVYVERASAIILVSTVLSVVSLSALLAWLEP
jgi:predicted permease